MKIYLIFHNCLAATAGVYQELVNMSNIVVILAKLQSCKCLAFHQVFIYRD